MEFISIAGVSINPSLIKGMVDEEGYITIYFNDGSILNFTGITTKDVIRKINGQKPRLYRK